MASPKNHFFGPVHGKCERLRRAQRARKKILVVFCRELPGSYHGGRWGSPAGLIFDFISGNESSDLARECGVVLVAREVMVKPCTVHLISARAWDATASHLSTLEKNHDIGVSR